MLPVETSDVSPSTSLFYCPLSITLKILSIKYPIMKYRFPLINLRTFLYVGHLLCILLYDINLTTELQFLPFIRQALILKMGHMFITP